MHAVKTQKVGVGFNRAKVVDRDDFDVCAPRFDDRPQYVAPDTSKTIDCYFDCHVAAS